VTQVEIRAMLRRVDARRLREDAGIRQVTVARALGVPAPYICWWESGRAEPKCKAGYRWARVIAGLERHAEVTAEMWQKAA
jgi:transcriptional regulator with XRE-family HTH domain